MSIAACAQLVQDRDPDRYRAAMSAPRAAQGGLLALYAFNTEVFHAVWATFEPGLAEIRLQYWRDQIDALYHGGVLDAHPVLQALQETGCATVLAKADFNNLINARLWDAYKDPFKDSDEMQAYLRATGGGLMVMAGQILHADERGHSALRDYGAAAALAAFFVAVPKLKARGRHPLPDTSDATLRQLAHVALRAMKATKDQKYMRAALPALGTASEAKPVLKRVIQNPGLVLSGGLERSEFRKRGRAALTQLLGRW